MRDIKAIFLDMDRTLCDTDGADRAAVAALAAALSARLDEAAAQVAAAAYLRYGVYGEMLGPGRSDGPVPGGEQERRLWEFARLLPGAARSELEAYEQRFNEARMAHFRLFPGVAGILDRLETRYRLAVITNGPLYSQAPKLACSGLAARIACVLIGGELGMDKPDPRIFALACSRLGVKPEEALHVGDSLASDIVGAKAAGIRAVWVRVPGSPLPMKILPGQEPDHILDDILELEPLLAVLGQQG